MALKRLKKDQLNLKITQGYLWLPQMMVMIFKDSQRSLEAFKIAELITGNPFETWRDVFVLMTPRDTGENQLHN